MLSDMFMFNTALQKIKFLELLLLNLNKLEVLKSN